MSEPSGTPPRKTGSPVRRTAEALRRLTSREAADPRPEAAAAPATPAAADRPAKPKKAKPKGPSASERRVLRAYARVGRQILGEEAFPKGEEPRFDRDQAKELAGEAARQHALAVFGDLVGRGRSLEEAHVAATRALLDAKERHTARALTLGLEDQLPGGEQIRRIGLGLVLFGMHLYELSWAQLKEVDTDALARLVPLEAATVALKVGTPEAVAVAVAIGKRGAEHDVPTLVELAGRFLAMGHPGLARDLVDEVERRAASEVGERDRQVLENLRQWTHPAPVEAPPAGAVCVGVIDYHQPDFDRASRNVGDYVQTLAMLGNLARFQKARFTGAGGLGELASSLQGRVKPTLRLDAGDADVHLLPVSRDFSDGDPIPESTWMVAFGWHMHSMFRLRFGLPYHPNVNPIFVSFHVNRVQTLTPEAIEYLRAHGPIGCRDWTTVDLLLSAGVDAFFTGCLTTTVNAVFPDIEDVEREKPGVVAVIDLPKSVARKAKRSVETVTHGDAEYRELDLVGGTRAAIDLLEGYQRRFHRIVTSRLHSYLPATSLGVPVSFQPHIPGDVRFDGLLGMEPDKPEFLAIRDGIRELIAETFGLVLAGAGKEEVYAHWREITADRVKEAKERLAAPPAAPTTHLDLPAVVEQIRSSVRRYGPHDDLDESQVVDVAMSLDQNFKGFLPVTVESVLTNTSGPVRLWVTARGLGEEYESWFARSFPDLAVTFLNFDGVDYGEIGRMIRHISIATMDRLLLPEVLDDLDRIVYIDIDTVSEGDVRELAAVDLQGKPLAARTSVYSGAVQWRQAGDLLSPEDASELRRTMSARHPFDFATFNAGVLVLDLQRMREDHFVETFLPMAARFGLNDQDLLNAYVGADRVELDPRWNALPVQETITAPGIVHFAGAGKPWDEQLVPYGDHWKRYAAQVTERIGLPPR